jgi:predicted MFS family arabinose efflux permease
MLIPHYVTWLVEDYGWRTAYVGLALLPLVLAGPFIFFGFKPKEQIRRSESSNAPISTGITLAQAVRGYRFWVLLVSIFAAYMAFSGISPNLIAAMTDAGMSSSEAATVLSFYGASIIVGRVAVGYLMDKFWAPGVAFCSMILPVIGCMMLLDVKSFVWASSAAAMIGFAAGAELDLMAFLVARYFGLKHYAKIYAIMFMSLAVCSGTAPMLFAHVYDVTLNYDFGFYVAAGFFAFGGLLVLALGRYPRMGSYASIGH